MKINKIGLSLTELIFSTCILAIVISGILITFVNTLNLSERANKEYVSLTLVKARVERARTMLGAGGFSNLPDLAETDTIIDDLGGGDPEGDYKRNTTVTVLDSNRTEFEVSVTYKIQKQWKDVAKVTLTTILTSIQ